MTTLEAVYTALLEKEKKEDLNILNNMNKIIDMIKELREFTIEYVKNNIDTINAIQN